MNYKVGDIVPYINTRRNVKLAKIISLEKVDNGKTWFNGIDIITGAKVWYPIHLSKRIDEYHKQCPHWNSGNNSCYDNNLSCDRDCEYMKSFNIKNN